MIWSAYEPTFAAAHASRASDSVVGGSVLVGAGDAAGVVGFAHANAASKNTTGTNLHLAFLMGAPFTIGRVDTCSGRHMPPERQIVTAWGTLLGMDDAELLARAERALTEIKVNQGLSEDHAAVLAALRIRLKGSDTGSLEDLLEAAGDLGSRSLDDELAADRTPAHKPSLDDLFAQDSKPKPDWPS